jgi:hypothetical protein
MREVLDSGDFVVAPLSEDGNAPFLGPYTLDEFCALPEDALVWLWDQAHTEVWKTLRDVEYSNIVIK